MMVNICGFRAAGTEEAAKAMYMFSVEGVNSPAWEELSDKVKEHWKRVFRAGHMAFRKVLQAENNLNNLMSSKECEYTQSHTRDFCGNPSCREA